MLSFFKKILCDVCKNCKCEGNTDTKVDYSYLDEYLIFGISKIGNINGKKEITRCYFLGKVERGDTGIVNLSSGKVGKVKLSDVYFYLGGDKYYNQNVTASVLHYFADSYEFSATMVENEPFLHTVYQVSQDYRDRLDKAMKVAKERYNRQEASKKKAECFEGLRQSTEIEHKAKKKKNDKSQD